MIRRASTADKPLVIDILTASFAGNQSVDFMTGGKYSRKRALMEYAFRTCNLFGEVFIADEGTACALLIYPERKRFTFGSFLLDLRLIFRCIGLLNVFKVLRRESALAKLQARGQRAYLWFIGVDPAAQHRGTGSKLLAEVIGYCEKQGRFLMLETSTLKNIPWYKSFGFQTYATLDSGYKLFFLKRDLGR